MPAKPKVRRLRRIAAAAIALLTCAAASGQAGDDFARPLAAILEAGRHPLLRRADFSKDQSAVKEFYRRREDRAAWFEDGQLTRQGVLLLQTLRGVEDYGLRLEDYDGTTLTYRAHELIGNERDMQRRAALDSGMTLAAARLLRHLHFGRANPRRAGFESDRPRAPFDVASALARLTEAEDLTQAIAAVEPAYSHYQIAKRALQRYRHLAIDRELTHLPSLKTRSIQPGDAYEGMPALRRLLVALGDLPADAVADTTTLDEATVQAIKRFQTRHGVTSDGALGRKTFGALTTPLAARAEQLALTLERWRWLPELNAPPIIVNIPQFRLFAFRANGDRAADILQMDVIVGRDYPTTRTPAFTADLQYVVFRPYWDAPPSIVEEEILPRLRADLDYLKQENLELLASDDDKATPIAPTPQSIEQLAAGKLRLRQRPGPDNALGLIKFMLPNAYSVYLHSTSAQRLFAQSQRAFSHGCIRVADPAALAEHVLRNVDPSWTRAAVDAALQDESPAGENRHVFLKTPIPVLIVYGTAIVLESGETQFFDDIYGHDRKLRRLLRRID